MTELHKKILLLPGDGIGPEIAAESKRLLRSISQYSEFRFSIVEGSIGGNAIDEDGDPLPKETLKLLEEVDAVLLAAIGGPKWENLPQEKKPESGLLRLRKTLGAYANLRPARVFEQLVNNSTLKPETVKDVDLLVVRELTGGIYFGTPRGRSENGSDAYLNTMVYERHEVERIARCAGQQAMKGQKRICSIDKANVLEVGQFWRAVVTEIIEKEFPEVELSHLYIDNAAMQLIRAPKQFDVILAPNLFGDILSDEASMLTGSIGLLPSASIGDGSKPGLFEPVHGSAPDIAGQNRANPIAMILSVAMMFEVAFGQHQIAKAIESAVSEVLAAGIRTADLASPGQEIAPTSTMGEHICAQLKKILLADS